MATYKQSSSGYLGGPGGRRLIMQRGTITLTAEGATATDMPASLFGLTKIHNVSVGILADDTKAGLFAVSADGTSLFFVDLAQATDANRANVADTTGSYVLTIIGE